MKKGIIVYQSRYGATEKYVRWLREITDFSCVETPKASAAVVGQYGTIVLCGGIYASGIAGISFLKKNVGKWKDRKIAVFCVGASPHDGKALEEIRARNLTGDLKGVPLFYGRGAWDESRMKLVDRTLCKLLHKAVAKRDPDTYEPWMKALMCAKGQACDWTDKGDLMPLLDFLKET